MIKTFLDMNTNKLKTIALLFGVLITIMLVSLLRNTDIDATKSQIESLEQNSSIKKVTLKDNYLYFDTDTKRYKIYKDALDYKDVFDKYPVEVTKPINYALWTLLTLAGIGFVFFTKFYKKSEKLQNFFKTKATQSNDNNELDGTIKPTTTNVSFKNIAGIEDVKEELEEIIDFLKNPKKYRDFDIRLPKGVLLVGPPGVGKTLTAKAVATEANVPFFYQSGATFVNIYVGMGAKRVSALFQAAKKNAPSIIFIDEIDAIGKSRGLNNKSDEREATLNQLLTEMDGFEDSSGVIVMAATNKIEVLDEALLRAGRFDRRVFLSLPNIEERKKTLELYLSRKSHKANITELAKMSIGFNFASLSTWVNEAALHALREKKTTIDMGDFKAVKDKVTVGKVRFSTYDSEERNIQATNQAAKALLATWFDISFSKIGIAMQNFETMDHSLSSKNSMFDKIKVYLAGSIATTLKYKNIYSNSTKDLELSKNLANKIVNDYEVLLQNEKKTQMSEELLSSAKEETKLILEKLDGILEQITVHLLEKEFITQEEIREMLREIF